jgi:hypothetical protein
MEHNEFYELYYKIALEVSNKQKGIKGAVFTDTSFETALEFAKQYKMACDGNTVNSKDSNCTIFDVSEMFSFAIVKLAFEAGYNRGSEELGSTQGLIGLELNSLDWEAWAKENLR